MDQAVAQKYKTAASAAQHALNTVLSQLQPGKTLLELCTLGDQAIESFLETAVPDEKEKVKKGIAFPTCVSVNSVLCHMSPLPSDAEAKVTIQQGDAVKIELGAHYGGHIAMVGGTKIIGSTKITGKQADVIKAAQQAHRVLVKMLKPGESNVAITKMVSTLLEEFQVNSIEGLLSHEIGPFLLEGSKHIAAQDRDSNKVEDCELKEGDVFVVDLLITSGTGAAKGSEARTTVYKRHKEKTYQLKLKTSRTVLSEANAKSPGMAFSLRNFISPQLGETKARLGIVECAEHGLVEPCPVVLEKDAEAVMCHAVSTVHITKDGAVALTQPFFETNYSSTKEVKNEQVQQILQAK